MTPCQQIVDPPLPGTWNMAVDEWLLERAGEGGQPALRFYQWAEPTLSLGYFQKYEDRVKHPASSDLPVVRRASGGGALVHHHELTYSLVVPADHPLARHPQQLYDAAHHALIDVLTQLARPTAGEFVRCPATSARGAGEPFLCFLRRAEGDVLYQSPAVPNPRTSDGKYKICGSAQRKHRGAVLQHGGVLLAASPHAPELPGIAELTGVAITAGEVRESYTEMLATRLDLQLSPAQTLSDGETEAIRQIERAKFADTRWTQRR